MVHQLDFLPTVFLKPRAFTVTGLPLSPSVLFPELQQAPLGAPMT
jgi:hypothetical protein